MKKKLIIKYNFREVISGGKLVPSSGSCGSKNEIEDGILKSIPMKKTEISIFLISVNKRDKSPDAEVFYPFIKIDGILWWRLTTDPNGY